MDIAELTKNDGCMEVTSVMTAQAKLWNNCGPVRTQNDMTDAEIRAIEEKYNAPVMRGIEIEKREPIESTVFDSWHRIRQEQRRKAGKL